MAIKHSLASICCLFALATAGCSQKAPDTVETYLGRAAGHVQSGEFVKAEKEYRTALSMASSNATALRGLGFLYYDQGQLQMAFPALKQAAELLPDDIDTQMKLALVYMAGRDVKSAREVASATLEKQPGHEEALLLLVDTTTNDETPETRKRIEDMRAKDKDRAAYHVALGALNMREKDESGAEREFKQARELDPKSVAAYSALGGLYLARQDLKAADEAYKTAADLSPPRSVNRLRYIDFKLRTGATAEATKIVEDISKQWPEYLPPRVFLMKLACAEKREDCSKRVETVLSDDPINHDALLISGTLSLASKDAQKAIRTFDQLNRIYTTDANAKVQLALAYLLSAQTANFSDARNATEAAERSLTVAVQLDPKLYVAASMLAELKIKKGNPAAAVDLLEPVISEQPNNAQAHFLLAGAYLLQQKADKALDLYRKLMELLPQDPQPALFAGKILAAQRKLAEARVLFERSLTSSADYLPAAEALIDIDLQEGRYDAALAQVQRFIDKDSKNAQALAIRGKIYFAKKDFKPAEADLRKTIELDPKMEVAVILLSQIYVANNQPERAVQTLSDFVQVSKTGPALMHLAAVYERLQQFEKARDAYEAVLAIAPDSVLALNNLAYVYSEHLGELDKAAEMATRAKDANSTDPRISDTLGWILFKKADYRNALRQLQDSLAKLPDDPEIQYHMAMARYMTGDTQAARVGFEKAISSSQDFQGKTDAQSRLALLSLAGGPEAKSEVQKFLSNKPNDPVALNRLSEIQSKEGNISEATKNLEKVVADNPSFAPAARALTLLYGSEPADTTRAVEVAANARQAYPDDPAIAKILGILNFKRGLPQSVDLMKEANTKLKDDPELLYYLGEAFRQAKQWKECRDTLQRAASLNIPTALAERAKTALAECTEAAPL